MDEATDGKFEIDMYGAVDFVLEWEWGPDMGALSGQVGTKDFTTAEGAIGHLNKRLAEGGKFLGLSRMQTVTKNVARNVSIDDRSVASFTDEPDGTRERTISRMSMELERHPAFEGDTSKALVWATQMYDAA